MTVASYGARDGVALLALEGALTYPSAVALRRFVEDVVPTLDAETIVLDLAATSFVDSTGLGVLAKVARLASSTNRRAILVCPDGDVATLLRSAAFDRLYEMVEAWPLASPPQLSELPLYEETAPTTLGPVMLDAHRDLAALSTKNRNEYAAVIDALERELTRPR